MSTRKYDCQSCDVAFSVLTSDEFIYLQIMEVPSLVEEGTPEKKKGEKLINEEDKAPHGGGGGDSGGGGGSSGGGGSGGGGCC